MTPRGSRPSSGGRDGGRLLDPAAEGVDVVPQECPVGAHDQHVDDVEADLDVTVGRVACEPGRCRDLKVAALDLAALEAPPSPYSVAVTSMKTRVSSSLAIRSIWVPSGEVQPASRSSKPLRSMKRVAALTAFS